MGNQKRRGKTHGLFAAVMIVMGLLDFLPGTFISFGTNIVSRHCIFMVIRGKARLERIVIACELFHVLSDIAWMPYMLLEYH